MNEVRSKMKCYKHKLLLCQSQIRSVINVRRAQLRVLSMQWNLVRDKCRSLQLAQGENRPKPAPRTNRTESIVPDLDSIPSFGTERLSPAPLARAGSSRSQSALSRIGSARSHTELPVSLGSGEAHQPASVRLGQPPHSRQAREPRALQRDASAGSFSSSAGGRSPGGGNQRRLTKGPLRNRRRRKGNTSSLNGFNFLLVPDSSSDAAQQMICAALAAVSLCDALVTSLRFGPGHAFH